YTITPHDDMLLCPSFFHLILLYTCSVFLFFSFFFYCSGDHRDLHSFPTRRSSDLSDHGWPAFRRRQRRRSCARRCPRTHRGAVLDRKSTRLNSSHRTISYAVFCLKKKKNKKKHKI